MRYQYITRLGNQREVIFFNREEKRKGIILLFKNNTKIKLSNLISFVKMQNKNGKLVFNMSAESLERISGKFGINVFEEKNNIILSIADQACITEYFDLIINTLKEDSILEVYDILER